MIPAPAGENTPVEEQGQVGRRHNHRSPSDPGTILYQSFPADTWQLRAYWNMSSNPVASLTNPDPHGPVTILH